MLRKCFGCMADVSTHRHDIIVVGGSTGGAGALEATLRRCSRDLKAAIFVVLHGGAGEQLLRLLSRTSALPCTLASDGANFEQGKVFFAPPDAHLLLHDDHMLVRRGPRENHSRPAGDPLFRSAACSFAGRVIGVVLSGALNDGAAGLAAIERCGGLAVVQDPSDAEHPSMPLSAQRAVEADHAVPTSEMGDLLARLVAEPASTNIDIPLQIRLEAAVALQEPGSLDIVEQIGAKSRFSCPDCGGVLWELPDAPLRFRCHTGHAFTADTLLAREGEEVELRLNQLLRAQRERMGILHRAAERERTGGIRS